MEGLKLVKVMPNRRAHRRLTALLQQSGPCELPAAYYSMQRKGNFYWLPVEQAVRAVLIPGISAAPDRGDLLRCWGRSDR